MQMSTQSQVPALQLTQPVTPIRSGIPPAASKLPCEAYIKNVNHELGLQLPLDEKVFSPAKRQKSTGTKLVELMRFLYYKNPVVLDKAISEVKRRPQLQTNREVKLDSLCELLTGGVTLTSGTIRPNKTSGPCVETDSGEGYDSDNSYVTACDPESPTLATKHLPHLPEPLLDMPDVLIDAEFDKSLPKQPSAARSFVEKLKASFLTASLSTKDTSFASTNLQTEPNTAATSFSSETKAPITVQRAQIHHNLFQNEPHSGAIELPFSSLPSSKIEKLGPTISTRQTEPLDVQLYHTEDNAFVANREVVSTSPNIIPFSTGSSAMSTKAKDKFNSAKDDVQSQAFLQNRDKQWSCREFAGKEPLLASKTSFPAETSLFHYRIHQIPDKAFGDGYDWVIDGPFEFVVERTRILHALPKEKAEKYSEQVAKLKSNLSLRNFVKDHNIKLELTGDNVWKELRKSDTATDMRVRMGARIDLSSNAKSSLFQTTLHPLKLEKSCRVQRKYGWHRLLIATVSSRNSSDLPEYVNGSKNALMIHQYFETWLSTKHSFLGRLWRAFYIEPAKDGKTRQKKAESRNTHRVFFFALEGNGISSVKFSDFINSIFPISENLHQSQCKAFTRFSLAVSTTTATICFKPNEVIYVEDQSPTKEPEDTAFNDTNLNFDTAQPFEAMNDGCSVISVAAAKLICKELALSYFPVAFQGRINGAKGIWFIEKSYATTDVEHQKVWIRIGNSQQKWKVPNSHRDSKTCEDNVYSFDVIRTSCPPKHASINRDFLQVLADRLVPKETLAEFAFERIKADISDLFDAIKRPTEPELMYHWITKHYGEDPWLAESHTYGLPASIETSIRMLLKAGFEPLKCQLLAENLLRLTERHLSRLREDLRIPCSRSTTVFGIADPTRVLAPGEVHLAFSSDFEDEFTHESWTCLDNLNVLVTRSPTLRSCDIQKVRAVYRPELAHLKDVLVFSSRGEIPGAAKLQGGDYDGDTFFICWEPKIVEPFRNAPLKKVKEFEYFDISQDKKTLQDLHSHSNSRDAMVDDWVKAQFSYTLQEDLLGMVTNYYMALSYHHDGDLGTLGVHIIADLHTHLIDAKKNGYSLSRQQLNTVLQKYKLPSIKDSRKYRSLHSEDYSRPESNAIGLGGSIETHTRLLDQIKAKTESRQEHVLDYVLVSGIDRAIRAVLEDMQLYLQPENHNWRDVQLEQFCAQVIHDIEHDPIFAQEAQKKEKDATINAAKTALKKLEDELKVVFDYWNRTMGCCKQEQRSREESCVRRCYEMLEGIELTNLTMNPTVSSWSYPIGPNKPSRWNYIKVSMMAKKYHQKPVFLFKVAGQILCQIKMGQYDHVASIARIEAIKKVRRPRLSSLLDISAGLDDTDDDLDSQSDSTDFLGDNVDDQDLLLLDNLKEVETC